MIFIILIAILSSLTKSVGDTDMGQIIPVPPLYSCSGKTFHPQSILAMCPSICHYSWDLARSHIIDIFNQVERERVEIMECSAHKEVRRESESYLFSKTLEIISSEKFLPKIDKCKELINKNCLIPPCNYVESLPDPDYSWGKDKIATYIRYAIYEYQESVTVYDGMVEYYIFGKEKVNVKDSVYLDEENLKYLIWKSHQGKINQCPFDRSKTVLAYSDLSNPSKLWVPDLGMVIHIKSPSIMDPRCVQPGTNKIRPLILTNEGLVIANSSHLETIDSSRTVVVAPTLKDNEKLILKSVNSMEMMREKEFCLANCYLIESKGLHILGAGGVYTRDPSSATICTHFVAPVIARPTQICKEPKFMLKISYDQTAAWWDPEVPIVNSSEICNTPMRKLPRKSLDYGAVSINSSGIYLKRFKILRDLQLRAFSQTHLDDYIVAPAESKIEYNYNPGSATITSAHKTSSFEDDYDNWFSSISGEVSNIWGDIGDFVSGIGDEIRLVSLGLIIVLIIWFVSLIFRVMKARDGREYTRTRNPRTEEENIEMRENLMRDYRSARVI